MNHATVAPWIPEANTVRKPRPRRIKLLPGGDGQAFLEGSRK
jgi:hypothetical protein